MQQPGLPTGKRILNPEHRTGTRRHHPREQREGKPRQGTRIPAFAAHHLMQAAAGKSARGKQPVQPFKTEGHTDWSRPLLSGGKSRSRTKLPVEGEASLKGRNAAAQLGKVRPAFRPDCCSVFWPVA